MFLVMDLSRANVRNVPGEENKYLRRRNTGERNPGAGTPAADLGYAAPTVWSGTAAGEK